MAAPGLEIEDHIDAQGHVTLKLSGELNTKSVSVLESAAERHLGVARAVMLGGAQAVTLDLSELSFLDSTGLAAVVLVSRLCDRDRRALQIIPGPQSVQRLFEITGLADVLPFREAPQRLP